MSLSNTVAPVNLCVIQKMMLKMSNSNLIKYIAAAYIKWNYQTTLVNIITCHQKLLRPTA